jgi:hypothetical protein
MSEDAIYGSPNKRSVLWVLGKMVVVKTPRDFYSERARLAMLSKME